MRAVALAVLMIAFIVPASAQELTKRPFAVHASAGRPGLNGHPARTEKPPTVYTVVRVDGGSGPISAEAGTSFHATAQEIQDSAGTYGDFSRYLQMYPGVAFNTDESNDVLVRGGNPIENLYLVDGIPVPNVNHIATEGTTGGLVSMIDTSAISGVDFLTGGYDARYDGRLSSVIRIRTRDLNGKRRLREAEVGFVGAGITTETPMRNGGALLISAHRSLLNLFTNNIGLNGVPIYANALMHADKPISPFDSLSLLSLGGVDSINITPEAYDNFETNTIDTQYEGWRITDGVRWQHTFAAQSYGVVTLADSEAKEDIHQQDQLLNNTMPAGYTRANLPATPVYDQQTHDGISDLEYDYQGLLGRRWTLLAGSDVRLHRVAYNVAQPIGQQTPLSENPARSDATSFEPHFWKGETGSYLQGNFDITQKWSIGGGTRFQTFAFGGHMTLTPRFNIRYRITQKADLHFSFGEYAQMPPYVYLTAFPVNRLLVPIRDRQFVGGFDFLVSRRGRLSIEGYRKIYWDYPVSNEYPTLSLANMVDTLGQEFIWLPMVSGGKGQAIGVELSFNNQFGSRLLMLGNIAYARNKFSGLDGVLRPGNFDYPVIANLAGEYRMGQRYEASFRYEYSSGRPYTPFLLSSSIAQNRPIYDLSKVNEMRGPYYGRLDFLIKRNFILGGRMLTVYGGLENALNRENFLAYAWRPRVGYNGRCSAYLDQCISAQSQMGIFPNFGARFRF
jgi:hypothetical protein